MLLDNSIDNRQAHSASLTHLFGREEGFKNAGASCFIHPTAGIGDPQADIVTVGSSDSLRQLAAAFRRIFGDEREATSVRHGVAGIDGEVDDDLFETARI